MKRRLKELQVHQLEHDEKCNVDIVHSPYPKRAVHYTLHLSYCQTMIYTDGPTEGFIDVFSTVLSFANMLNIDLETRVPEELVPENRELKYEFTITIGKLSKACEALDHLEAYNSREALEKGVIDLCQLCLTFAARNDLDLSMLLRRFLERKSTNREL